MILRTLAQLAVMFAFIAAASPFYAVGFLAGIVRLGFRSGLGDARSALAWSLDDSQFKAWRVAATPPEATP